MHELARNIQRQMVREGYMAAAEEFMERAGKYSERELKRIGTFWLN